MSTNRRTTMSFLAGLAVMVGAVAFLAGPAAASESGTPPGLTSGTAWADNGSVASGSAIAINDSTASGDAVAIDGSVASGCSTATWYSTASGGGCEGRDDHEDDDGDHKAVHHAKPASAKGGALALTGSSSQTMVMAAGLAVFAGAVLLGATTIRRRSTTS